MIIRNLQKKDAGQVAPLIFQLTRNIVEPENLCSRLENLADALGTQYIVAEKNNHIVGFAGLVWYGIPSKGLVGWIEEVVVDQNYRRQGIGQSMVGKLLSLAKAKGLVQVKLTACDDGSKKLYQACGFADKLEVLMVKKYY